VRATVIVCTHNRADILERCIDAIARELEDECEIVVVDSASTDDTGSVIGQLQGRWPMLRHEHLAESGLSRARNHGIEVARGDVLLFLDDDAEPRPGWFRALIGAFDDPNVAGAGGPSQLVWPGGEPSWATEEQCTLFSAFDLGGPGRFFEPGHHPFGVNMAVRREWAEKLGGFSSGLGRRGASLLSNEELVFFARLAELGGRSWYEPGAQVLHHVPDDRRSRVWLLRRAWAQGRSDVRARRLGSANLGELGVRALVPRGNLQRLRHLVKTARARENVEGLLLDEVVEVFELAGAVGELVIGRVSRWRRPT
jgi:glycosyltransferase involved in cell wall biosynthesis